MNRFRRLPRLDKTPIRLPVRPANRRAERSLKQTLFHAFRVMAPTLLALSFVGVAHAQGTMDFSGAQTLMGTFNGRFAYVSVSRASHDAQLFTNDASTLTERLSRDVSKTSALNFGKAHAPAPTLAPDQSQLVKKSPAAGLGLAL